MSPEKKTGQAPERYQLRLYIAGMTASARAAIDNLERICEEHLAECYELEVIDLIEQPALADGDQIFAVPTLVRKLPPPLRKLVGDMSNTAKVLVGLDLRPKSPTDD